jgi:cell wall assembly regulator SMI1
VPFLRNSDGCHLCIDLNAEDGSEPGQLITFLKTDDDKPTASTNLHAWLTDLVPPMKDGALELA